MRQTGVTTRHVTNGSAHSSDGSSVESQIARKSRLVSRSTFPRAFTLQGGIHKIAGVAHLFIFLHVTEIRSERKCRKDGASADSAVNRELWSSARQPFHVNHFERTDTSASS